MTKIVFMGSPDFALPSLRALASARPGSSRSTHEGGQTQDERVVGVITQPDRASGRGRGIKMPPVKILALELGIPVMQPEKLRAPEAMQQLLAWKPDLIVVAAYGQILKKDVLDLPRFGCLNVHASLLPRWRGAAPINAAILHGDEETGVTIMQMDVGLDTGPILAKRSMRLTADVTAGSVTEALSHLGARLLIETLPDYLLGNIIPQPQPEEGATYAPMLKKDEGRLDFRRDVNELERQVRAFNPWPGAFMDYEGGLLKVHKAHVEDEDASVGDRLVYRDQPAVAARGGLLILDDVQPAGKKSMSGKSFLAGARHWVSNE